ncbi:hypothetical protein DFH09DRAFT_1453134 [Mycena vulgaris]|nr:hypothetical protein DFH09DRAFT_1453134 [Mycena vulgaris]
MPAPIPAPSKATMPSTRSARLRDSAPPFNAPGRKSMFYRACGFTINGGTFNIGSQTRDTPRCRSGGGRKFGILGPKPRFRADKIGARRAKCWVPLGVPKEKYRRLWARPGSTPAATPFAPLCKALPRVSQAVVRQRGRPGDPVPQRRGLRSLHGAQFRAIPTATAMLKTEQYAHIPPIHFLCLLTSAPKVVPTGLELCPDDVARFKTLTKGTNRFQETMENGRENQRKATYGLPEAKSSNRISRYIEHFEINLSMENNPNNQPGYGDRTGATEFPCEGGKDGDADGSEISNGPIQLRTAFVRAATKNDFTPSHVFLTILSSSLPYLL